MARLQIYLHGQQQSEQQLMTFIKSPAGILPDLSSQEFDDVDDSVLGIVALL